MPTATIASAKAGSNWAKELLAVTSNTPPSLSTRDRKAPIRRNAITPISAKATSASGNRYSTTPHRPGTKTSPRMNPALTAIASASGIASN